MIGSGIGTARALALGIALVVLAACAAPRMRGDAATLDAQSGREAVLAARTDWRLEGKLAVSDGRDGGSGELDWNERGDTTDFALRAPVTGRSFHLVAAPGGATLEGVDATPIEGPDAESVLHRALGWNVPVRALRHWVRGARAPGAAHIEFRPDGLPARIIQDGWVVDYRDWFEDHVPPLPRKVYAERAPYRVRLSIRAWDTP